MDLEQRIQRGLDLVQMQHILQQHIINHHHPIQKFKENVLDYLTLHIIIRFLMKSKKKRN